MSIQLREVALTTDRKDPDQHDFMSNYALLMELDDPEDIHDPEEFSPHRYRAVVERLSSTACYLIEHVDDTVEPPAIKTVGSAVTYPIDSKEIFLDALAINEEYRNRGYGTEALRAFKEMSRLEGYRTIKLHSFPKAVSLYRREGFTQMFGAWDPRSMECTLVEPDPED